MSHVAEGLETALEHQDPEEGPTYEELLEAFITECPTFEELFEAFIRMNEPETALEHQEPEECPTLEESWEAFRMKTTPTFRGPYGSDLEMPLLTGINDNNGRTNDHTQSISEIASRYIESLQDIMQLPEYGMHLLPKYGMQAETTEDLYHTFCRGFPLNDGEQWFFLDKNGKKCVAVSAREALEEDKWKWMFLAESRFEEVADYCNLPKFSIFCKFRSKLLSPETTYGAYLVYKLPEGYKYVNPPPVTVVDKDSHPKEVHSIFLQTPQTPVISYNDAKGTAMNPSNMPKMKGLPKQRSDGWMEVQIHEFQTSPTLKMVSMRLSLSSYDMGLQGITVQCLEFRPI